MSARLAEPDYQLVMPRALFTAEAAKLLNQRELSDWNERCELLLADAFVHGYEGGPLSEFREIAVAGFGGGLGGTQGMSFWDAPAWSATRLAANTPDRRRLRGRLADYFAATLVQ